MEFEPPLDEVFVFVFERPPICPIEPACWFEPEMLPVTDDSEPTSETDLLFDELFDEFVEFDDELFVVFEAAIDSFELPDAPDACPDCVEIENEVDGLGEDDDRFNDVPLEPLF